MGELIYNLEGLDVARDNLINRIDKAVAAAAFRIRDNARSLFKLSKRNYKYATQRFFELEEGINVGRKKNHEIKVHAFGTKEKYNSFKTRFFVGGTRIRFAKNGGSRGYIKASNVLNEALDLRILEQYIKNTINNG